MTANARSVSDRLHGLLRVPFRALYDRPDCRSTRLRYNPENFVRHEDLRTDSFLERLEPVDRELDVDDAFELHVELPTHVVKTPFHIGLAPIDPRLPPLPDTPIVFDPRTSLHHTRDGCLKRTSAPEPARPGLRGCATLATVALTRCRSRRYLNYVGVGFYGRSGSSSNK